MPNYLPELRTSGAPRSMVNKFWGLNKTPTITDGEFADMRNMTSDHFPLLAVREPRGYPILMYVNHTDPETMTETEDPETMTETEEPEQNNEQGDAVKPRCITMATALVSAFTGKPVRKKLAMTGEITLRGDVLPVGGIREKLLAARRAGVTDVVLCEDNRRDVEDIPEAYMKGLTPHYVRTVSDVLREAFE